MNYVKNDYGENVIATGAPGSIRRVEVEYPRLIKSLRELRLKDGDSSVSMNRAVKMIKSAGPTSRLEISSILAASGYSVDAG